MQFRGILPALTIAAVLSHTPAWAQADANNTDRIDQLLKRIEELEAAQKEMRKTIEHLTAVPSAPVAVAAAANSPAPTTPAPAPEPAPEEAPADTGMHILGPVQFSGFTDFSYGRAVFENLPPGGLVGSPNGFGFGDVDQLRPEQEMPQFRL